MQPGTLDEDSDDEVADLMAQFRQPQPRKEIVHYLQGGPGDPYPVVLKFTMDFDRSKMLGYSQYTEVFPGTLTRMNDHEDVAVKVWQERGSLPLAEIEQQAILELRQLTKLDHPNVIHVHNFCPIPRPDSGPLFVLYMELCDENLETYIRITLKEPPFNGETEDDHKFRVCFFFFFMHSLVTFYSSPRSIQFLVNA